MKALMVNGPLKGQWRDTYGRKHGDTVQYPKIAQVSMTLGGPIEMEYDEYLIFEQTTSFYGYTTKLCFGVYGNPTEAGMEVAQALYQRDMWEHGKPRY